MTSKRLINQFILLLLLCLLPSFGFTNSLQRDVLVIHSYHQGLGWTDSITKGISNTFDGTEDEFGLHFDYLDSKRNNSPEYFKELRVLYSKKAQYINYSLIIVSDNNALNFYLDNTDLFPTNIPVVFCGINNYSPAMLRDAKNITGVAENINTAETIELMLRLHPHAKNIVIVNDKTITGQAIKSELIRILPQFKDRVSFTFLEKLNPKTIADELASLGPEDLIYLLTLNKDYNGRFISYKNGIETLRKATDLPIYGSWDFYLGDGIVGGNIVSGFKQGRLAAAIALRILDGKPLTECKVRTRMPNEYQFDYLELQRAGIDMSQLPKDSQIINKPEVFAYKYIRPIIILILALIGLVAMQAFRARQTHLRGKKLEQDKAELDHQVEERTQELNRINRQLTEEAAVRQAVEAELRNSNNTKDKFFSIIAHDLKNPFCGLIGLTELLKEDWNVLSKEERTEAIEELHTQSTSTYKLLQDLLTWANLEQNNLPVTPEWLCLKDTVDTCCSRISSNARAKKISIINEVEPTLLANLDRFVLTTVINNLCGNAIKFTPLNGRLLIQAETSPTAIIIRITDDGIGMSSSQMEHIFTLNGCKSRPGTNNEKGTGLGLVICQELVVKAGGTIQVKSGGEGKGTTFIITLPQYSSGHESDKIIP